MATPGRHALPEGTTPDAPIRGGSCISHSTSRTPLACLPTRGADRRLSAHGGGTRPDGSTRPFLVHRSRPSNARRRLRPPGRRLPHAGIAPSARTFPLPASTNRCSGLHLSGAQMRRWWLGATRITGSEVDARNRSAHVPASRCGGVLQRRLSAEAADTRESQMFIEAIVRSPGRVLPSGRCPSRAQTKAPGRSRS